MIGSNRRATIGTINQPWATIRPYLRDGSVFDAIPGNKLPGYDHSVPPGRKYTRSPHRRFAVSPIRPFASAPRQKLPFQHGHGLSLQNPSFTLHGKPQFTAPL